MAQQWSILVVEGDEALNRSIVNTLAKDGYSVRGVATGGEAIRILWVDEQHLVISDRTLPDADGFDLLQWIRTYRPTTRMMMLAAANLRGARTQALENGAVAYLEKPLDLLLLKVEVRRLLQQSGFSASLASFDLLDVIQIINMSRKSIALLVHTGLEEQGLLGFKVGELTWAEYGNLRGEEAFFALAAYKNGTVTQQPWNDAAAPNVTQPLSRLILQALQYRSKYATAQQLSGEYEVVSNHPTMHGEEPVDLDALDTPFDTLLTEMPDDRPFVYVAEEAGTQAQGELEAQTVQDAPPVPVQAEAKEWWQESAKVRRVEQVEQAKRVERPGGASNGNAAQNGDTPVPADPAAPHVHQRKRSGAHSSASNGASITPSTVRKTPTGQRPDLPSWLMDQPTQFEIQALRPSSLTGTGKVPSTPVTRASNAEWQPPQRPQPFQEPQPSQPSQQPQPFQQPEQKETPGQTSGQTPRRLASPNLQSLKTPRITEDLAMRTPSAPLAPPAPAAPQKQPEPPQLAFPVAPAAPIASPVVRKATFGEATEAETGMRESRETRKLDVPQSKRNYPALVAALQTLGYSLPGFVASAVVSMDGQPIAQVAIDDLDIAGMCTHFSTILQAATRSLDEGGWERHEDTIITSATHHILLRVLGNERDTFQALVTTRETDPVESLDVLANVEGAIIAAL